MHRPVTEPFRAGPGGRPAREYFGGQFGDPRCVRRPARLQQDHSPDQQRSDQLAPRFSLLGVGAELRPCDLAQTLRRFHRLHRVAGAQLDHGELGQRAAQETLEEVRGVGVSPARLFAQGHALPRVTQRLVRPPRGRGMIAEDPVAIVLGPHQVISVPLCRRQRPDDRERLHGVAASPGEVAAPQLPKGEAAQSEGEIGPVSRGSGVRIGELTGALHGPAQERGRLGEASDVGEHPADHAVGSGAIPAVGVGHERPGRQRRDDLLLFL